MYITQIILPLLGAVIAGFLGRKIGITGSQFITISCVLLTTILATITYLEVCFNNIPVSFQLFRWVDCETLMINWGFNFDALTVYLVGIYSIINTEAVLVLIQLYKNLITTYKMYNIKYLENNYVLCRKRKPKNNTYQILPYNTYCNNIYIINLNKKSLLDIGSKKYFRTVAPSNYHSINLKHNNMTSEFLHWFVGFTDAEGCFIINSGLNRKSLNISYFTFMFKIALHIDDEKVLRYINTKLNIGGVRINKDMCIFTVTKKNDIHILISIFDRYHLNTSKYLDYLDFKKAFFNYVDSTNINPELIQNIIKLKNKMNNSRIYFDRPEKDSIIISKFWLLGFIEGDGSFFINRNTLTPTVCIENTYIQLAVFIKIKEFLENTLNFDMYSLYKIKHSSIILINTVKSRTINGKSTVTLTINNINIIYNYIIPFFSEKDFLTKKVKDYIDFKIISKAIYVGSHRKEEVKFLILKLSNTMNNYRLSTYKGIVKCLNKKELDIITSALPCIERIADGRVRDVITRKILPRSVNCVYEIQKQGGEIILANSLTEAALVVNLYPDTLSRHLDIDNTMCLKGDKSNFLDIKSYKIRRVGIFFGNIVNS